MRKIIITILCVALFLGACSNNKKQAAVKLPPQLVNTIKLEAANVPLALSYPAKLSTDSNVIIKAKVSGEIQELYFKAGQSVKKGDALYLIDPSKYQAAADMAYGDALLAKANYDTVAKDYERNKILIKKKAISPKEFDASKNKFDTANGQRISAQARLKSAKIDLDNTLVKAPFDGVLSNSLVDVGEYVVASNSSLVRIVDAKNIHADFFLSDVDKINMAKNINEGSWEYDNLKADIIINGVKYTGKLDFLDSIVDEKTPLVRARASFDNTNLALIPGVFTNIKFYGFVQKNGFKVPQVSVLQDIIGPFVFIADKGKVLKKRVEIAYQDNEFVVISKGLKSDEKLIINNFKKIRQGANIMDIGDKTMQEAMQGMMKKKEK